MNVSRVPRAQRGFAAYIAILAVVAVFVSILSILLLKKPSPNELTASLTGSGGVTITGSRVRRVRAGPEWKP